MRAGRKLPECFMVAAAGDDAAAPSSSSDASSMPSWRVTAGNLAAGATAGITVEAVLYPIDTIKTRLQVRCALYACTPVYWQRALGGNRCSGGRRQGPSQEGDPLMGAWEATAKCSLSRGRTRLRPRPDQPMEAVAWISFGLCFTRGPWVIPVLRLQACGHCSRQGCRLMGMQVDAEWSSSGQLTGGIPRSSSVGVCELVCYGVV